MIKYCILSFLILTLFSCKKSQHDVALSILQEWEQKEILFPSNPIFIMQDRDTFEYQLETKYKILTYIDSVGCTSCKLHLPEWNKFIQMIDSLYPDKVQFLFYFSSNKKMKIRPILLKNRFKYPVCIDQQDSINILNHFPMNTAFQTFLLDKDNKVIAIGNPIHNPKIKELYLKVIVGENLKSKPVEKAKTNIVFERIGADMGTFDWKREQSVDFLGANTGDELLVIEDISTSCGCTKVEYSKEPVQPGQKLLFKVKYKAEHPEHFDKTITVYCNVKDSPFQFHISGNAE